MNGYAAMSHIWGNSTPKIDITRLNSPELMVEAFGKAAKQTLMKNLVLSMDTEQLTASLLKSLDRFEENRVELFLVSGTVDRDFVDKCRRSKTIMSIECQEGVQVTVPAELIEDISRG